VDFGGGSVVGQCLVTAVDLALTSANPEISFLKQNDLKSLILFVREAGS
jgi:hypothetical protein